jgi:hypothetical protein
VYANIFFWISEGCTARIERALSPGRARSPGLLKRPEREWNLCQTIAVNFDGTPGMGREKIGEIGFPLFQGQLIGATIKVCTDPAHSARVGIDGFLIFALELEHAQMMLVKFIKSFRFRWIHGISFRSLWRSELNAEGVIH